MKPSNNANKQFYPIKLPNLEAVTKGIKTEKEKLKSSKVASFTHNIIKSVAGLAYDFTEDYAPELKGTFKTMKEVLAESKKEAKNFRDRLQTQFESKRNKSLSVDQITDYVAEQTAEITKRLKKGELYKTRDERIEEAIKKEFPDLAELENELDELGDEPGSDSYASISDADTLSPEPFGGVKKGRTRKVNVSARQRAQRSKSPTKRSGSSSRKGSTNAVVSQLTSSLTNAPTDTGLSGQIASTATTSVGQALLAQNETVSAKAGALSEHHFNKLYTYQNGILRGVNSIVEFNNNVTSKQIASQLEFQGKSLALTQDMFNSIKELKDAIITFNGYGDTLKKDDNLAATAEAVGNGPIDNKILSKDGKFNVKNFVKNMKQNISREIGASSLGSLFLQTSMADNLLGDDNIAKSSMSIMDTITNALARSFISRRTTNRLRDMSESFEGFLPMLMGKMRATGLYGKTPIKRMLGRILSDNTASLDIFQGMGLGEKVDDSYRWTRKSDRTLNEVIPTLLAKQLSAMTGNDELYYDYKTGRFSNTKLLENKFRTQLNQTVIGKRNLTISGAMADTVSNIVNTTDTSAMNNKDKYVHNALAGLKPHDIIKHMNTIVANITKSKTPFEYGLAMGGLDDRTGEMSPYANTLTAGIPKELKIPMLRAFAFQFENMNATEQRAFNTSAATQALQMQGTINEVVKNIGLTTSALSSIYEATPADNMILQLQDINNNPYYRINKNASLNSRSNLAALEGRTKAIQKLAEEYGAFVEEYKVNPNDPNSETKFRFTNNVSAYGVSANGEKLKNGDVAFSTEGNVQNIYKLLVNGIVVYPQSDGIPKELQDLRKRIWNKTDIRENLDKYNADRLIKNAQFYKASRERELIDSEIRGNVFANILGIGRTNDIKKNANILNIGINKVADFVDWISSIAGSGIKGGRGMISGNNMFNDQLTAEQISSQVMLANSLENTADAIQSGLRHIPIIGGLLGLPLSGIKKIAHNRQESGRRQAQQARETLGMDNDEVIAYVKSKYGKYPEKEAKILEKLRKKGWLETKLTGIVKKFIDQEDTNKYDIRDDNEILNASANSATEQVQNGEQAVKTQNTQLSKTLAPATQQTQVPEVKSVSRDRREIKPDFTTSSVGMKSIYDLLANGIVTYNLKTIPKNLAKLRKNLFRYDDAKTQAAEEKENDSKRVNASGEVELSEDNKKKNDILGTYNNIINGTYTNKYTNYGRQTKSILVRNALTFGMYRKAKGFEELRDTMFSMGFIDAQKWSKELLYANILGLDVEKLNVIRETDEFKDLEKAVKKHKGVVTKVVDFFKDTKAGANKLGKGLKKIGAAGRMLTKDTVHFRKIMKILYNRQHLIDPDDDFDIYKLRKPELLAYINALPTKTPDDKMFKQSIMATDEYKDLVMGYSSFNPKNLLKNLIVKPLKAAKEFWMTKFANPFRMVLRKTLPFRNLLELMKLYMQSNNPGINPNDVYKWSPYQLYANILAIPDDNFEAAKFKKAIMLDDVFAKLEKFIQDGGNNILKRAVIKVKKIKSALKFGVNSIPFFGKIRRYKNIVWFLSHQKGYEHAIDITDPGIIIALLDAWVNDESETNGTKASRQLIYKSLTSTKEYMELEAAAEAAAEPRGGRTLKQIRAEKRATRKKREKLISKYKVLTTTLSIQGYDFKDLKDPVMLKNTIDTMEDEKTKAYLQSTRDYKRLATEVDKSNFGGSINNLTNSLKRTTTNKPFVDTSKIKNAELKYRFENKLKTLESEGEESVIKSVKALTEIKKKYVEEMKRAGLPYDETSFKSFLNMWGGAGFWGISGKGTQLNDEFYTTDEYVDAKGVVHKNQTKDRLRKINDVEQKIKTQIRASIIRSDDHHLTGEALEKAVNDEYNRVKGRKFEEQLGISNIINAHGQEMESDIKSQTHRKKRSQKQLRGSERAVANTRSTEEVLGQIYNRGTLIRSSCEGVAEFLADLKAHPLDDEKLNRLDDVKKDIKYCRDQIKDFIESYETLIKTDKYVKRYKVYKQCEELKSYFIKFNKNWKEYNDEFMDAKKKATKAREAKIRSKEFDARVRKVAVNNAKRKVLDGVDSVVGTAERIADTVEPGIKKAGQAIAWEADNAYTNFRVGVNMAHDAITGSKAYADARDLAGRVGNKVKFESKLGGAIIADGVEQLIGKLPKLPNNVVEFKPSNEEETWQNAANNKGSGTSKFKAMLGSIGKFLRIPKIRRANREGDDTNEMNDAYSRTIRSTKNPVLASLASLCAGINRQNTTMRTISQVMGVNEKGEIDEKNKEAYPSLFLKMINGIKKLGSDKDKKPGKVKKVIDAIKNWGGAGLGGVATGIGALATGAGTVWGIKRLIERTKNEGLMSALLRTNASQDFDDQGNEKTKTAKVLDKLSDPTAIAKNAVNTKNAFSLTKNLVVKKILKKGATAGAENAASTVAKNATKFSTLGELVSKVWGKLAKILTKIPGMGSVTKFAGKISKFITEQVVKVATKCGVKGVTEAAAKCGGKAVPLANVFLSAWDILSSATRGWSNAPKYFGISEKDCTVWMKFSSAIVEVIPAVISGVLSMLSTALTATGIGAVAGVAIAAGAVGIDVARAFIDFPSLAVGLWKLFQSEESKAAYEEKKAKFAEEADKYGTTTERLAQYEQNHRGLKNAIVNAFTINEKIAQRDAQVLFGDDPNAMEKYLRLKEERNKEKEDEKSQKGVAYKKGSTLVSEIGTFTKRLINKTKDWYGIYSQWCANGTLGKLVEAKIKNAVIKQLKRAKLDKVYDGSSYEVKKSIAKFNDQMLTDFLSSRECAAAIADAYIEDDGLVPGSVKPKKGLFAWWSKKKVDDSDEGILKRNIANKVSKLIAAFIEYFFKITELKEIGSATEFGISQNTFSAEVIKCINDTMSNEKKAAKQEKKFEDKAKQNKINDGPKQYSQEIPSGDNLSDKGFDSTTSNVKSSKDSNSDGYNGPNTFNYSKEFNRAYETKDDAAKAAKAKEEELNSSPAMMEDIKSRYPFLSQIKDYKDANAVFHDNAHYNEVSREVKSLLNSGDNALIAYFAEKIGSGWSHGGGQVTDVNALSPGFRKKIEAMLSSKYNENGEIDEKNGKKLSEYGINVRESVRSPLLQLAYFSKSRTAKGVTDMLLKLAGISGGWMWGDNNSAVTQTLASAHAYGTAADFTVNKDEQIKMLGKAANQHNLDWGGDWSKFKDYPHVQSNGDDVGDQPRNNVDLSKYSGIPSSQTAAMSGYRNDDANQRRMPMIGGMPSNIAQQHFAKGGIVIGAPEGDKVPIKANGGEMVLTRPQQTVLFGFLKDVANKYVNGEPVAKLKKNPFAISDEKTVDMINEALEIQRKIYAEQVRHDGVTEKLLSAIVSFMEAFGGVMCSGLVPGRFSSGKGRIRENIQDISSTLTSGALANASGI